MRMSKAKRNKCVTSVVCGAFAACLALQPMQAGAAGQSTIRDILMPAGIASYIEVQMTEEEYVAKAQELQRASFGYTHLGICNVESGNLNVRAEASTGGKLVGKMPKNAFK